MAKEDKTQKKDKIVKLSGNLFLIPTENYRIDPMAKNKISTFSKKDPEIIIDFKNINYEGQESELAWGRGSAVFGKDDKVISKSFNKNKEEVPSAKDKNIYLSCVGGLNPHWEYEIEIKNPEENPYYILNIFNYDGSKENMMLIESNQITGNIDNIDDICDFSTLKSRMMRIILKSKERKEIKILTIDEIDKKMPAMIMNFIRYIPEDLRQQRFEIQTPEFRESSKDSLDYIFAMIYLNEVKRIKSVAESLKEIKDIILSPKAKDILLEPYKKKA